MSKLYFEKVGDINLEYSYIDVSFEKGEDPFLTIEINHDKEVFFRFYKNINIYDDNELRLSVNDIKEIIRIAEREAYIIIQDEFFYKNSIFNNDIHLKIERYIEDAFNNCSIKINSLVIKNVGEGFGDFCAVIDSELGNLRIVSDIGQVFIDFIINDTLIRAGELISEVSNIYKMEKWSLEDLLSGIKLNYKNDVESNNFFKFIYNRLRKSIKN